MNSDHTNTLPRFVIVPAEGLADLKKDIADIKAYMIRNPRNRQEQPAGSKQEYCSPKELRAITGYSPATMSRRIQEAHAAGVQIIGDKNNPKIHREQFLAFLENTYTSNN